MSDRLMVLPAGTPGGIRVVSIPEDREEQEAFRHVTGIISEVEEGDADYTWDDIEDALEEHGYHVLDFVLGPSLD
ncbi:MAG: hypothetical protein KDI43_06900 [Gammaproteobacteria bacterium]|nr:hypothetical protein [Gammaproteobacteria bacterium]MCP5409286.1 hypothetical protein [Chromatiaceae bacterium]MCP5444692.1 hypothetical protein [Chromatiaceae bacterium]